MNKGNGFEDLEVWQLAIKLSVEIHAITKKFPKEDFWSLGTDIRTTSYSISSNIAEGASRPTAKDFAKFIGIALGSNSEVKSQLCIAKEVGLISQKDYVILEGKISSIGRMLKALQRKLQEKANN